ncbi:MAG TPA: TIGR03560 family F420-dependent LLM class oxidoreductase [Candidatus Binatia bacterium]|nr:TIGR03560 family F420-dependent LLM class oxidoreductase [Candidatus Binatia bacterium]
MATGRLSRRGFVKGVGGLAAASALGVRIAARARAQDRGRPGGVRFGVQPRPEHTTYREMLAVWQECDDLGFDSAFTFDHFMPIDGKPGPCFEGWTLLSALAARTSRLRVGVLVTGNTYRAPALVAKMAATVDHVSDGRLILGMGAGWFEAEHTAYGIPFYTAGRRARRLVEAVEAVKALFTQDATTFGGKYYQLKDAPFDPKTVQRPHPPILIGGMGPKVIQPLAARHADIWNFHVPDADPTQASKLCTDFDGLCRKVGRDPAAVEKSINLSPGQIAGRPASDVRKRLAALVAVGVRHFVVSLPAPYDRGLLRTFAKEVVPALRTG